MSVSLESVHTADPEPFGVNDFESPDVVNPSQSDPEDMKKVWLLAVEPIVPDRSCVRTYNDYWKAFRARLRRSAQRSSSGLWSTCNPSFDG